DPLRREVSQADTDGIAVRFFGEVEHNDRGNPRTRLFSDTRHEHPTQDIGVHARARDVLAHFVHDQNVEGVERQRTHQTSGSPQQGHFVFGGDAEGLDELDAGGGVVGVLKDGEPADDLAGLLDHEARHARHHLEQPARAVTVDDLCAGLFAETDGADLGQPTFERTAKVGVRLDPVHQQDVIRFQRGRAHEHWHLVHGADLLDVHAGDDRHAHALARDAVASQDLALALRGGSAVAAHGRNDEWTAANFSDGVAARAQDRDDVGDAAAAGCDRHALGLRDALQGWLEL